MLPSLNTRKYGAVPFWFWNGDQQEPELTRQMELAAAGGFKGLAIHARTGNRTEYMSERWIALCRHCCEEARRLGLEIWLYDEEGFPSGTVGHRLQRDEPFFQQKILRYAYQSAAESSATENLVAVYDADSLRRVAPGELNGEQEVLAFQLCHLTRYVDTLKRETAERFMDMTHRRYLDALGNYFGDPITHVYTDDLNSYLDRSASLPWTEELPAIFRKRVGYDLLDHLPALVENVPGSEKVRLDFRGLVQDLFLNEFVAPMHRWCDKHGVIFTGHLSGDEGEMDKSARRFGSAMAFYEHEHIPGIDDFLCSVPSGRYLDELRNPQNHCPVILCKQASSVANQLKGGACGSEALTYLGWGAPVWGQSAFLNYQLALGVNLMTHHDCSYATGGVAKRDCPPSYFFQQPYWPQSRGFHEAIARSTELLRRGRHAADVLVIHPMSSCWTALDGRGYLQDFATRTEPRDPGPRVFEDSLAGVSHQLLKLHVGFDYGDEWLLARHGKAGEEELTVGDVSYTTVILPELNHLLGSTVCLLRAFQESGGRVIAVNPAVDCLVDGETASDPVFGSRLQPESIGAPQELRTCGLTPTLELATCGPDEPVICHTRAVDGVREHFVYNCSDRPRTIRWGEELQAYDPMADAGIAECSGQAVLPPFHSVHLLPALPSGTVVCPVHETLFAGNGDRETVSIPAERWRITLEQPNLMLIDWCELPDGRSLYYDDRSVETGPGPLRVTLQIPGSARVAAVMGEAVTLDGMYINGTPVPRAVVQHASSQDMLLADVDGLFCEGSNEISWKAGGDSVVFEPFYLVGDVGVALAPSEHGMRPELRPLKLAFGDLVECGLPFYWGGVRYETQLEGDANVEWLDCGDVDGVVTLSVNGAAVGCRYMPPYRFRVADQPRDGANRIAVTVFNTAQNLYGPHRRRGRDALDACSARGDGDDRYMLAGFGIHGPIRVCRLVAREHEDE